MTDHDFPDLWVWRCEKGHDVAVSEATFRYARVRPVCVISIGDAICASHLTRRRVRPFHDVPRGTGR